MWQHLWRHSRIILGELDFGGCSRTRVMTLSVLSLGPQFPNIPYFAVCECLRENIMLLGSISAVRQYWKYPFFLCPTMEALGASHSIFLPSHVSSFHAEFSWYPTRRFRKKLSNIVLRLLGPPLTTRTRRAGFLQEAHIFFKRNTRGLY